MVPPRRPYPFQTGVATLLLQGKNVILQAPTGSGKTHAALLPFLNGLEKGRDFPRKCLYSVPMRVLAKQFVSEYQSMVTAAGRDDQLSVAIQTGEQARDPYLAQDLIFATIDQTLSSFLLAPYSLSRSRANINAAAVMSAYLVFDEFHLYDPISTLPTTLHMLQLLKGITPFLLMTATFSETMLDALAARLDAVVVPGSEAERQQMRALASQQKTRRYHIADEPLTAEAVLSTHDRRSLAICNTVDRARRLYQDLREAAKKTDTQVILLHSRFQREDRDRIEDNIRACFGKDAPHRDGSFIVVATQAIEVGVDITSTRLHTELAPANAILQRAGRCARYPGAEGDVFIYRYVPGDELGETVDLIESVAPYMKQEDEFESTFAVFCDRSGHTLDFVDEQQVISAVHGKRDAEIIRQLDMDSSQHRRRLFAVMRQDEGQDARNLIREVLQQHITIHSDPDTLLEAPFDVPAFGLHPGTLQKYVKQWLERAYELELDKPIWYLKRLDGDAYEFAVQNNQPVYKWEEVKTPQAAWGAPLIVVHPALATYDPDQGFIPDVGGRWQASLPPRLERQSGKEYRYRLETYARHIELVYNAAFNPVDGVWHEMDSLARRLETHFGWPAGSVRRAAEVAVLLHDVGKLSRRWQSWVREYQQAIGEPVAQGEAYAHTELQTDAHRQIERQMRKRPWHAVEGAVAALPMIVEVLGQGHPLVSAAFSAIARHHATSSESLGAFRLVASAADHIGRIFKGNIPKAAPLGLNDEVPSNIGASDYIAVPTPKHLNSFLAYLLLVRVLRRADQRGTEEGSKGA